MEYKELKELKEKFWEGECSEEEETNLRDYIRWNPEVHEDFQDLKDYFSVLIPSQLEISHNFEEKILSSISSSSKKVFKIRKFIPITAAASVLVLFFIATQNTKEKDVIVSNTIEDTYQTPEEAFIEVKKTLMMISGKMNNGKKYGNELGNFSLAAETLNSSKIKNK